MHNNYEAFAKTLDFIFKAMEPHQLSRAEQDYEARCEAEREGAPRFCGACQHYHEPNAPDEECPYLAGLGGPML